MARYRRVNSILKKERQRKYRLRAKSTKFIPATDSDFAQMARTFANHVAKDAERFAVAREQVERLNALVEAYRHALCVTMRPDSAGPLATRKKNTARKELEASVRAVARTVRACDSLNSVDRLLLNMQERPERLKARVCPQVAPVLRFIEATRSGIKKHVLEYGNDFDHGSNAKPHGAARMELFVELCPVGGPVPTHPGQLSGGRLWYLRSYSTSRFEVEFPVFEDGRGGVPMLVVYWGRWADARGGFGPFSQTCVARVEGGPHAMPQLMHFPGSQPELASVSRRIEPKQHAMLEAKRDVIEQMRPLAPRQLASAG